MTRQDDISVYTNWEKDTIRQGFDEENNLFYVLTNSRGFTAEQTTKAHNEIAAVVDEVAKETGKEYIFISRSDSTLRGHYPLETELLKPIQERRSTVRSSARSSKKAEDIRLIMYIM